MDISVLGKDYKTKFNIGDIVYAIKDVAFDGLCPKCKGNGYYHKEDSIELETCSYCNGNGIKLLHKKVVGNVPLTVNRITFDFYKDSYNCIYALKGKYKSIFGDMEKTFYGNDTDLFATIEEAEKYCAEQNTVKKTMNLADIIIQPSYLQTYPNSSKIKERMDELKKHGKFTNMIEVDMNNVLMDGYTTYVLAKGFGFEEIEVIVREDLGV